MPRAQIGAAASRRVIISTSLAAGGGLLLGFELPPGDAAAATAAPAVRAQVRLNAYLRIAPDNSVTLTSPKAEMGQGAHTGLALLVAEELEIDWSQIKVETASTIPEFPNLITGGSRSIVSSFDTLRRVGAEARELLRRAAAARWKVPLRQVRAADGHMHHDRTKSSISYGRLVTNAAKIQVPQGVTLKASKDWRLIGTSPRRVDTPMKVDGSAAYGIDVKVPGMLIGAIAHCPVIGGFLRDVDSAPAMAISGVQHVVKLEDAVVVLADGYWPAQQGIGVLKPQWNAGAHAGVTDATIAAALQRELGQAKDGPSTGNVSESLTNAEKVIEGVYEVPYLAHAPMEPMNATAWVRDDAAEIWAPVQAQTACQRAVAEALGRDPARVLVHTTYLGGGFGRRLQVDYAVEAALASRAAGKPVKLIWSRAEDIRRGPFRPRAKLSFRAGVDKSGKASALEVAMAENSAVGNFTRVNAAPKDNVPSLASVWLTGGAYNIPNAHFAHADADLPVPVGPWRSVQFSHNGFFGESIIDELAHAAGADPLAFRKSHVTGPRYLAVLDKVGEMSGWGMRKLREGTGLGIALVESFGTVVAQVAEVAVTGRNVRLNKVWCAAECGTSVFPAGITAQMESGIIFGLSAAFFGQINVDLGRVVQSNFNDYELVRLAQVPEIHVALMPSNTALGGAGEPGVPPIAPALTNAIFAARGERVRTLPLLRAGFLPV